MAITINGTSGITTPELTLDNAAADGGQVVLKSSGYSNWNIDNYSDSLRAYYNATEYMRMDSSGNLGIGTSSPSLGAGFVALKTKGSGAGGVGSIISESTDGTTWIDLYSGAGGSDTPSIIYPSSKSLRFGYGTQNTSSYTEAMRIDSSGNLLVAGTANPNSGKVAVNVANSGRFMSFINNSNSAEIGYIQNNSGTVVIYSTSSDYRLKENIAPMTGALEKVKALKPVTYTWKSTGNEGQGFIAHELQQVCPDAVCGTKDEVDAEGNPVYQGIDTSFLVATLTAAIQEQQAIIMELKARVESLENK